MTDGPFGPARFETGRPLLLGGLRRGHRFADGAAGIARQWDDFRSMDVPGRTGDRLYGVLCGADAAGFEYMCGVEVTSLEGLPDETGRMRVPEQRYAVFVHPGRETALETTWRRIFAWLETGSYVSAQRPDLEVYAPGVDPWDDRDRADGVEVWVGITPRMPPRVETPRLLLRPWRMDDAPALREALSESVEHLLPWIPWATASAPTEEETAERLEKWVRDFQSGANHIYGIFHPSDGQLLGGVGLYPRVGPAALEIGYWIRFGRDGRGFATEAAEALTRVAFDLPDILRVEIHTDAANLASRKVPEKLGYRVATIRRNETRPHGGARDTVVFELARDEQP
ncbi:MAG TPA: GNAT family N-acetyltransferase [Longimicrobiales bacterium]|nr:GNAT family N-acetyltransferase [Longimicrobiales bacterium]